MSNLTPVPIVDKNGRSTTVHKNLSADNEAAKRSANVTPPISATDVDEAPDVAKIIESIGDKKFSLLFVAYDDQLRGDQMTKYLSGDTDSLEEEITENFSDAVYYAAEEEAKGITSAAGYDWDDLDWEEQQEVRLAIEEKDDSDPIGDLVRNTHSQLMRTRLADNIETAAHDYTNSHDTTDFETGGEGVFGDDFISVVRSGHNDRSSEARVLVLQELLGDRGFDVTSDEAVANLQELVENGPFDWHEGVTPEIIWYGDISSANVGEYIDGEQKTERRLDFGDEAHVLLIDRYNGSGHEVSLKGGAINATVSTDNPVILDSDSSNGYGWDEVAGVHKPAYKNDIDSEWT